MRFTLEVRDDCDNIFGGFEQHRMQQDEDFELTLWNLFQGFVISDWAGIDKLTYPWHTNYTYSILEGVNTGIDMVSH